MSPIAELDVVERRFMKVTSVFLVALIGVLIWSVVGHGAGLASPAGRVDPDKVRDTAPFDDPGLHQTGPGEYDLVLVAQAWQWTPAEVSVPVGSTVTIIATTVDAVHGLWVPDTQVNAMVIPGQITEMEVTFDEVKDYSIICHEYCGIGHHTMGGLIHVTGEGA